MTTLKEQELQDEVNRLRADLRRDREKREKIIEEDVDRRAEVEYHKAYSAGRKSGLRDAELMHAFGTLDAQVLRPLMEEEKRNNTPWWRRWKDLVKE